MAIAWPSGVNQKAYGMDTGGGDNVESVEFESGKARTYLKNSAPKKLFSFVIRMDDVGSTSEFKVFVYWWENSIKSGSLAFTFPDLITHTSYTEYRATQMYSVTGQRYKEVKMSVEEM